MKLTATSESYAFEDASGYKFTVNTYYDPEFGWSAQVTMSSNGLVTSKDAINFLKYPVQAFLKQLEASIKTE